MKLTEQQRTTDVEKFKASKEAWHRGSPANDTLKLAEELIFALLADLEEAEADLAATRKQLEEAQAKLAAAEKDAERYRVLRVQESIRVGVPFISSTKSVFDWEGTRLWNEAADAAIDAAIASREEQP